MVNRLSLLLGLAALALLLIAANSSDEATGFERGKVTLESAGALAFGPDGVLLVGDSIGGAIYAIDVDDREVAEESRSLRIEGIDEKLAAALGTTPGDIRIHDLAVHRPAQAVYLSVSRGSGDDSQPVIVRVSAAGEIDTVSLEDRSFARYAIADAPAPDARDRRGRSQRTLTITDLAFADGQVYVAGLSNQEFASTLRRIPFPFSGASSSTSLEIYHGAHGQYETHAPIRSFVTYELDGKPHLLAGYTCTPLVTFPVDQLADGQHLKGKTIAELGFGNTPLDMLVYKKEGEEYLLILNSSRSGMKIKIADIAKAKAVTDSPDEVTYGVEYIPLPLGGILHVDVLNDSSLVALRRDLESGTLSLGLASTRWL